MKRYRFCLSDSASYLMLALSVCAYGVSYMSNAAPGRQAAVAAVTLDPMRGAADHLAPAQGGFCLQSPGAARDERHRAGNAVGRVCRTVSFIPTVAARHRYSAGMM